MSDRLARRLPFFYGYVMMGVAMMVQVCTSPGQTFAISAFTPALRDGLQMSDSRLSLAYMLGTLFAAFPLSLVGPLADRWGLRRVTWIAVLALAATCHFASRIDGFAGLFVAFFLLRFLGQGSLTLLGSNAISMWFRTRLGRVSAVMSIGTAIAFAWVPGWLTDAIELYGWRQTFVGISMLVLGVMTPLLLFLFVNRPEDIGQSVDGIDRTIKSETSRRNQPDTGESPLAETRPAVDQDIEVSWRLSEAGRTVAFPILAACNTVWAMIGTGVIFHLFTLCDDRGMSESLPPDLFKVFGLSMLALQLSGGVLADFLPLHRMLGAGVVTLATGMGCLVWGNSAGAFYAFAALFGGGQGLLIAVGAVVWVRYFGRRHLGKIRGTVWCLTVAGSGCGPLLMGVSRDWTGRFDAAILGFFLLMIPLAVAAWFARPPVPQDVGFQASESSIG